MKIEKPGHYRTANNQKAEVVAVRDGYAVGFGNDDYPTAWVRSSGQHYNRSNGTDGCDQRLAIVAEWREPAKQTVTFALVARQAGIDVVWSRNICGAKVLAIRTVTITEGEGMSSDGEKSTDL